VANPPTSKTNAVWPFRSQNRCGLLVSVRDAQEARLTLQHGVDIMDLKEPSAGALGTVPELVIEQIQQLAMTITRQRRPRLSFALGELTDWDFQSYPRMLDRYRPEQIAGMSYVKIGLAGAHQMRDWRVAWSELFAGLPASLRPVVVAYLDRLPEEESVADDRCPDIDQLIDFAKDQSQVTTILLDTCDKQSDLFASVGDRRLQEIIAATDRAGLDCVVAGSVGIDSLQRVMQAGARLVGVRGAVCDGDRNGQLCEQKLVEFKRRMFF